MRTCRFLDLNISGSAAFKVEPSSSSHGAAAPTVLTVRVCQLNPAYLTLALSPASVVMKLRSPRYGLGWFTLRLHGLFKRDKQVIRAFSSTAEAPSAPLLTRV